MAKCTTGHVSCQMEFRLSIAQMNDAIRRAQTYDLAETPYGVPSYPYLWHYDKEHNSIRLEMGRTEKTTIEEDRRIIAMFIFQVNGPPTGVGVLVHLAVWLADDQQNSDIAGLAARHSANTNYHLTAIAHFKDVLLKAPGGAYAVSVPENLPPPPQDEVPPPPPTD